MKFGSASLVKRGLQALVCAAIAVSLLLYAHRVVLPSKERPILFYSSHSRDDLKQVVLKALSKAKRSLRISTYALTDPHLFASLQRKAEEKVEVRLLYHGKNLLRGQPVTQERLHLTSRKGRGLMHEKWFMVDEHTLFLGTANLTTSSLTMHENFLMGIYSPVLCTELSHRKKNHYHALVDSQHIDLFFLPNSQALSSLLTVLNQAKSSVILSLFTFTHPVISETLVQLHRRRVHVELYLDQRAARGSSKKVVKQLREAGIRVRVSQGLPLFHHKWGLIDSDTLILGSANWTKAAFEKNQDLLLFLTPLNCQQQRILKRIVRIIGQESVRVAS